MSNELPAGWRSVSLDEVLENLPSGGKVQQDWSPQCDKEPALGDEWGVLKTTAIQPGEFVDHHHKRLPQHFKPRPTLEVRAGDLLLTNAGPRARCAVPCLVRSTRTRLMLSGKLYRFRTDENVMDRRFLEYLLLGPVTQERLDRMKTGINDSGLNLTRARFLSLPVVVPPLDEQHRIVQLIENHLSHLDAAESSLQRARVASRVLRTQLIETELRAVTVAEQSLEELAVLITDGDHNPPKRVDHGVPHVTAKGVRDGLIRLEGCTYVSEEGFLQTAARYLPRADDVIVTCVGTIGRVAVVPDGLRFSADRNLAAIRLDIKRALPAFVALWLETPSVQAYMRAASGSTAQPHFYLRDLRRLKVRLPTLADQRRVLARVEELSLPVTVSMRLAEHCLDSAPALRRSLLSAAFSGLLTTCGSGQARTNG